MHPLTDAIWSFDEDAEDEKCEQDIARLADLLDAEPSIDAQGVIGTLTNDLGTVIPRTVPLIRQAEPLVVFFNLGASVLHDIEAEAMIAEVTKDGAATTLSAMVLCDFYQPHKMWLWCNPGAAQQFTPEAVKTLYELFPLHEFEKTGLI